MKANKEVMENTAVITKNKKGVNEMTKQEMRKAVMVEMVEIIKETITDDVLVNDCGEESIMHIEMSLSDKTLGYLYKFDYYTERNQMRLEAIKTALEELSDEGIEVYEIKSHYEEETQYYTADFYGNQKYIKERIFKSWYVVEEYY